MNRSKALTVVDNIIDPSFRGSYCEIYEAEFSEVICPQLKKKVIWFDSFDNHLFNYPVEIIANLRLFLDLNDKLIVITEDNYKDYIEHKDFFQPDIPTKYIQEDLESMI